MAVAIYAGESWAIARRWFWHLRHEPVQVIAALMQPALWLLLFGNLFSQAGVRFSGSAPDYISFMTAGVVIMTVFNSAMSGGIEVLFDRESGFHERLMAAPIHRTSLLTGRYLYVLALSGAQGAVILGVATAIGVQVATGIGGAVVTIALSLLLGIGVATLSLALAFVLKGHGTFFVLIAFISLPLIFTSNALAPLDAMPAWMQVLAHLNPMTYAIQGARSLINEGWQLTSLATVAGALIIFDVLAFALASRVYRGTGE
jgi:ABC-2 type transport system permease protein